MSDNQIIEKYDDKDDFDNYKEESDIFTGMQQHLTTHIGLSMGIITTLLLITNNKIFITSQLKYVIILMMMYSVALLITGYGEYIEKFINYSKLRKNKKVNRTKMDNAFTYMYFVIGVIMLLVMLFLYYSIIKEKIV